MHVVVGLVAVIWVLAWLSANWQAILIFVAVVGGVPLVVWLMWKFIVKGSADRPAEKWHDEWRMNEEREAARGAEAARLQAHKTREREEKRAREEAADQSRRADIWQEIVEKKEAEQIRLRLRAEMAHAENLRQLEEALRQAENARAQEEERSRAKAALDAKRDALVQEMLAQQGGGEIFADVLWETDILKPVTLVYGGSVPGVTVIDNDTAQVKGTILFKDVIRVDAERSQFQDPDSSRGKLLYSRAISRAVKPGEATRVVLTFFDNQNAGRFAARFKELLRAHREASAPKAKETDWGMLQRREQMHTLSGAELASMFRDVGIRVQGDPPVDDVVLVSIHHDYLEAIRDDAAGLPIREQYLHIQDHVCSASLAVALRTLESTQGRIIVNSYKRVVSSRTGRDEHLCILSVSYLPEIVEKLTLQRVDPSDCMTNFPHRMNFLKTKGLQPIIPIEANEMLVMA